MTLGQEFSTYAVMLHEDEQRLGEAIARSARSTWGHRHRHRHQHRHVYSRLAIGHLPGFPTSPLEPAPTSSRRPRIAAPSSSCREFPEAHAASKLSQTYHDLRLPVQRPQAGFSEIHLPPRAAGRRSCLAGQSHHPPVMVNQIAFEVIGNDVTITMAAESGQLQLNAFQNPSSPTASSRHRAPGRRLPHPHRPLRPGHHRQPGTAGRARAHLGRPGHRPQSPHRLRERHPRRPGALRRRPRRRRTGARNGPDGSGNPGKVLQPDVLTAPAHGPEPGGPGWGRRLPGRPGGAPAKPVLAETAAGSGRIARRQPAQPAEKPFSGPHGLP